ncbi:MAG: RIP metalloprotease RseP [Bacteroidota bacterium]
MVMIAQLILSLSILIVLHELGHFVPAKLFKTRVEKFYLFFDPGFELFKHKIGETEYGIGWLPLGGYVKISGMIDESMDTEQMKQPPQPWEFRSKPAWQRLIIMLGGVTVNFILGLLIFAGVLWFYGQSYLPTENATYGIAVDSTGYELGLRDGDHVLSINGEPFEKFNSRTLKREIVINGAREMVVQRDDQEVVINIDPTYQDVLSRHANRYVEIFAPRRLFIVDAFSDVSPAKEAGLAIGDSIVTLDGASTPYFHQFLKAIKGKEDQDVELGFYRDGALKQLTIRTTDEGKIGVGAIGFDMERQNFTFAEAIPAGFSLGWMTLTDQLKAFGAMFRGDIKVTESLGGFASIGSLFGGEWIWERFWIMTATLSLILAFMNLLPIPALDGGHVVFLLYEVATGRKPSDKFMEYATIIGFVIVLGLVILANGLDIKRFLFGG